jgi:hypothetical protein
MNVIQERGNMEDINKINNEQVIDDEDTSAGQEIITKPFNPNDIEIETPPFTVGYLIDRIEHDEINMNTDFQREGNLWTQEKQSRLIESILLGLPLPAFYFDTSNKKWDIIDGLQRCCSIKNFCIDDAPLSGLEFLGKKNGENYLEGKRFKELDRTLQRSIITRPITVNLLKKAPRNVRYVLFKRLNTGGLELTPQEIRNAVYQGVAIEKIKRLAKSDIFRQATDGKIPTNRMQDCDFVSRFVGFYLIDYRHYIPGLDDFINSSMDTLEKYDIQVLEEKFKQALQLAIDIFGKDAFRKRKDVSAVRAPINKAYFEVLTVSFAKLNTNEVESVKQNGELLKNNLITLMNSDKYSNALSRATGTRDSVSVRFSLFQQVLEKSINNIRIKITNDNKIEDSEL